jgi:pyruvate dehydrogenase E2 component (dihydrolipoamide acetyltransferase)
MSINILMPALSPTMTEGKLAKWHVKVGDAVKSGQVICEIETDKATMEVEAVDEGRIGQIVVPEGAEGVKVNAVIAILLEEGEKGAEGRCRARRRAGTRRCACSACSSHRRVCSAVSSAAAFASPSPSVSRPTRARPIRIKAAAWRSHRQSRCRAGQAGSAPRRHRHRSGPGLLAAAGLRGAGDTASHTSIRGDCAAHARVEAAGTAFLPDGGARSMPCAARLPSMPWSRRAPRSRLTT